MLISNQKIKKHIVVFFAASAMILILVAAVVIWIDPFFHYHAPIEGFPYVVDNQLTQNPGMAEHMEYDSVILGSSMTVNFETDWFSELMGLKTLKLSYSSAYPRDIANILSKIYGDELDKSGKFEKLEVNNRSLKADLSNNTREIKKVFLGLDVITYSGEIDETKYPIPEYLYDNNYLNDIAYLLNKDVFLNYIIKPVISPDPTNLSHVYASWWTDEYYNEDWVLSNHDAILEKNPVEMPAEAFNSAIEENLKVNIVPFIENHPETEFVIFFPPYSILFWNDVIMDNHLKATLDSYKCVADNLLKYDNVSMFFFPAKEDVVTDLNNYADYTHYHPWVNRYMAECFVSGDYMIKSAGEIQISCDGENDSCGCDIDSYIEKMKNMINNYDFEALQEKLKEYSGSTHE